MVNRKFSYRKKKMDFFTRNALKNVFASLKFLNAKWTIEYGEWVFREPDSSPFRWY